MKIDTDRLASSDYYPSILYIDSFGDEFKMNKVLDFDKKIAVHIHLYYQDLLDEFISYLNNIPFKFDIYVSTPQNNNVKLIRKKLKHVTFSNNIIVKYANNIGRDFGPMFFLFGKDLCKYDYLLHIHTKKSLRMGNEQNEGRKYLLNNLIGNPLLVLDYLTLMEKHNVGVCYPKSFLDIPCGGHTWLQSFEIAKEFYTWLDIKDEYLPFSPGSMFGCKKDAIKQLFELNLSEEDFGPELGQDEGTLAHTIERFPVVNAIYNNYDYAVFYPEDYIIKINFDDYNFDKNYIHNQCEAIGRAQYVDNVAFGLFGTLINLYFDSDELFLKALDYYIAENFNLEKNEFLKYRKKAIKNLTSSHKFGYAPSLDDIYLNMSDSGTIDNKTLVNIRKAEIDFSIKFMCERKDVVVLFNQFKSLGKKIDIISDTYFSEEETKIILSTFGITGYNKLYLASEIGVNKTSFKLGDYYFRNSEGKKEFIFIGDDETRDINYLAKHLIPQIFLLNPGKLYYFSQIHNKRPTNIDEMLFLGVIINKGLLNSPFVLNEDHKISIKSYYNFGFSIIAPIIYLLIRNVLVNKKWNSNYYGVYNYIENNIALKFDKEGDYTNLKKDLKEDMKIFDVDDVYLSYLVYAVNIDNKELKRGIDAFFESLTEAVSISGKNIYNLNVRDDYIIKLLENIMDGSSMKMED